MIHIKITPEYKDCKSINEFVMQLPETFDTEGTLLYDKRNTIKSFHVDDPDVSFQKLVVKRFKKTNLFQSIVYGCFCDSKAKRAFNNAIQLRSRGIYTPKQVAYIEEFYCGLLKSSYVVTYFTDGVPIRDFFIRTDGFDENVAEDFARFVVQLHENGILHHDLNSTNVLYHQSEEGNYFSVIDINRMTIDPFEKRLTPEECFENLTRFTGLMELYEYVLRQYLRIRNWDENMIVKAVKVKREHDRRWVRRKSFFNKLKKVCHV